MLFVTTFFFATLPCYTTIHAFPTGAGSCAEGPDAIGGTHLERANIVTGTLEQGGISVTLGTTTLAPFDTFTFPINTNTDVTINGNSRVFKGFLIRLGETEVMTDTAFITPTDTLFQIASACTSDGVGGVTHTSNDDKSSAVATILLDAVATSMPLDITVVIENTDAISEYYFTRFTLSSVDEAAPVGPGTPAPALAPVPATPTATAPTATTPTATTPTATGPFPVCIVCGPGKVITIPDGQVSPIGQATLSCEAYQLSGLNGMIDSALCPIATAFVSQCGCADGTIAPAAPPGPTAPATAAPSGLVPTAGIAPTVDPSSPPAGNPTGGEPVAPTVDPSSPPAGTPTGGEPVAPTVDPSSPPAGTPTGGEPVAPTVDPSSPPAGSPTGGEPVAPTVDPSSPPVDAPSSPIVSPTGDSPAPSIIPVAPVVPPAVPPVLPPSVPPAVPPVLPPSVPPAVPPVLPPSVPPAVPPVLPPSVPPAVPPVLPPSVPPTIAPVVPPAVPPAVPPVLPPSVPPTIAPVVPPAVPPVTLTVAPIPIAPQTPVLSPVDSPVMTPPGTITKAPTTAPTIRNAMGMGMKGMKMMGMKMMGMSKGGKEMGMKDGKGMSKGGKTSKNDSEVDCSKSKKKGFHGISPVGKESKGGYRVLRSRQNTMGTRGRRV